MTLREICNRHGLTPKGVDYALMQYQTVICEITHGMLSKLTYDASIVIQTAQERWCDGCDIKNADTRENVHGKWIKLDMHRGMEQYKCSSCGESCYVPECMGEPMYLFCPNCGAQMNGGNGK